MSQTEDATAAIDVLASAGAGLLLDLDGTLIDSEPMIGAALADYFTSRGWDVTAEQLETFRGRPGRQSFSSLPGPWLGEDPDLLLAGVAAAIDPVAHPPRPIAGAAEAIAYWAERDVPIALVTSAEPRWAQQALDLIDVTHHVRAMVTAADVTDGKPSPTPFLLGAQLLGVEPSRCVVAEDSLAGITAARAAGVAHVLGVATSLDREALTAAGADSTAEDLSSLVP